MATARAIRTSADDVDLETDFTKYNLGIENLWGDLKLASKGLALSPVVDVAGALSPTGTGGSVFDVLSNQGSPTNNSGNSGSSDDGGLTSVEGGAPMSGPIGSAIGSAVGFGVSTAAAMAGMNPAAAGIAGSLTGKAATGKDINTETVVNAVAMAALNAAVPGLGLVASITGFNPAQGFSEAFGLSDVTPGYEGGFFGKQGIGIGLDGGATANGNTPGFGATDLGAGISTGYGKGVGFGPDKGITGIDISAVLDALNTISPTTETETTDDAQAALDAGFAEQGDDPEAPGASSSNAGDVSGDNPGGSQSGSMGGESDSGPGAE